MACGMFYEVDSLAVEKDIALIWRVPLFHRIQQLGTTPIFAATTWAFFLHKVSFKFVKWDNDKCHSWWKVISEEHEASLRSFQLVLENSHSNTNVLDHFKSYNHSFWRGVLKLLWQHCGCCNFKQLVLYWSSGWSLWSCIHYSMIIRCRKLRLILQ